MINKISKTLGFLFLGTLIANGQEVANSMPKEGLNPRNECEVRLIHKLPTLIQGLEGKEIGSQIPDSLVKPLSEFEECEVQQAQGYEKLVLAYINPDSPEYIQVMEQIMPGIFQNEEGNKKFEEVYNGELIRRLLAYYRPNSDRFLELEPEDQGFIFVTYAKFSKIPQNIESLDKTQKITSKKP